MPTADVETVVSLEGVAGFGAKKLIVSPSPGGAIFMVSGNGMGQIK